MTNRYLIDTHILLWAAEDNARLHKVKDLLSDSANIILYSPLSICEIYIKTATGKLTLLDDFSPHLDDLDFTSLPFTLDHAEKLKTLPWHHKDPFDRMIIAQASYENFPLITADTAIHRYDIQIIKA